MPTETNGIPLIPRHVAVLDMLLIASCWCFSLLLVNPSGNFPLNDDWSYGLTVKHLIENGDFRPTGWASMPHLTNALWGLLFCIPAGFSFTALRLSTLALSLLGVFGVYLLIRDLRQPRWLALVSALTLGFNPIYYALSNTFMTDVPYTAIAIYAAVFLARNLRTGSNLCLLIGTAIAVAATLSRQVAVAIPFAFAVTAILTRRFAIQNCLRAVIPLFLCLSALLIFNQWLETSGRLPANYSFQTEELLDLSGHPKRLVLSMARNTFTMMLYLGLFLLPVLFFTLKDISRHHVKEAVARSFLAIRKNIVRSRGKQVLVIGVVAVVMMALICVEHALRSKSMMFTLGCDTGNVLIGSGIGPLTLRDAYYHVNQVPMLPRSFWLAAIAMGLSGALVLIAALGAGVITLTKRLRLAGRINGIEITGIFLLLSATITMLPFLANGYFDRYMVPLIPFIAAGILGISGSFYGSFSTIPRAFRIGGIALIVAFSFFSVCSTRDYLMWNRLRWESLHDLMVNKHISEKDIDGGFEFNGLYLYGPRYQKDSTKSWWWVQGDTYQICFGEIPGYSTIEESRYRHWLPPYSGKVVVLRKEFQTLKK